MSKNKQIKILLVEDDPFLLSMYSIKFELEKFAVVTAEAGDKALELARSERPDIILLDVMLPVMNGFEVLEKLKADEATAAIPVILLTNLNQQNEVERGLTLGAADYLIKAHFVPSEVVAKIKTVLGM